MRGMKPCPTCDRLTYINDTCICGTPVYPDWAKLEIANDDAPEIEIHLAGNRKARRKRAALRRRAR